MKNMTIGKLAKLCGVGVETVRFYEREGLIRQPERKPSGYRNIRRKRSGRFISSGRPRNSVFL